MSATEPNLGWHRGLEKSSSADTFDETEIRDLKEYKMLKYFDLQKYQITTWGWSFMLSCPIIFIPLKTDSEKNQADTAKRSKI